MSSSRWLISLLIGGHLIAMFAGAFPIPDEVGATVTFSPQPRDSVAESLTPATDAFADRVARVAVASAPIVVPVRRVTARYLAYLGMNPRWIMFSHPAQTDEYVRARYFVRRDPGDSPSLPPIRVLSAIVVPAWPEDRVRGVESFRLSYWDRAFNTMIQNFHTRLKASPPTRQAVAAASQSYRPAAQTLARTFEASGQAGQLVRLELWHGSAPNPPRGSSIQISEPRMRILRPLYGAAFEQPGVADSAPLLTTEQEGDVLWTLEYVAQW